MGVMKKLFFINLFFTLHIFQNSQCMEDQDRRSLITINSNFSYNTNNTSSLSNSLNDFMMREASYDQLRHRTNTPYAALPAQTHTFSAEQQKQFAETLKIHAQVVNYANALSKAAQTQSTRSTLALTNLTFSVPGITQDLTQRNVHLQNAINQSTYILCKPDGSLKASLSAEDHYQIARTITNYLKKEMPNAYKQVIENFKKENRPCFQRICNEENAFWMKQELHKKSDLYPSNPLEMRQRVLENIQNQELRNVVHLFEDHQLEAAKYIVDCYKDHVMYNSSSPEDDYLIISKLYAELSTEYCTKHILQPLNISANLEIMDLLHEVAPYAASQQPMKVIDHFISVLTEKQNDPKYYEAIKPLFDQRGLPRLYNFDECIFKDIIIPSSIIQPEHLKERVLLLKVAVLASQEPLHMLQAHRNAVGYIAKACSTEGLNKELHLGLASAIVDALEGKKNTTILQCGSLILDQPNQMQLRAQDNVMKTVLNLVDTTNNLQNKNAPRKFIKDNQSDLLAIDKQFHEVNTFEDLCKITEASKRIAHRLQTLSGPIVRRSESTANSNAIPQNIKPTENEKTILQNNNFSLSEDLVAKENISRRTLAARTNLSNEINRLKQEGGSEKRIDQLQTLLLKLNKEFESLDHSATSQVPLNRTIAEIVRELDVLNRPEMCRTKSQEDLPFFRQSLELLHTGKTESYSSHEMQKFQTSPEQKPDLNMIYERSLMRELLENDKLWNSDNGELKNEIIHEYLASSQESALREIETIKLNRDTQLTLAENVEEVIKDCFKIVFTDLPLKEIGDYAHETITHPGNYLLNAAKDFGELGHFLCSCVVDYSKNNISAFGATQKEAFEFSKKYNEAVHAFSKNWKELPIEHKKEFVAKLLVDLAANKALGSGAKLISRVMGDCIISMGEFIPPSMSGGNMLAVPQNIALIQELATEAAGVVQGVGEIIGSTPFGTTAIQGTSALLQSMNEGQAQKSKNYSNEAFSKDLSHTLDTENNVLRIIDNEVTKNIRSGKALKLDSYHKFSDIIDNYVEYAQKFDLYDKETVRKILYQIEGSLNGEKGIFEWIVHPDPSKGVVHRLFIKDGIITGKPNIWPGKK